MGPKSVELMADDGALGQLPLEALDLAAQLVALDL